MEYELNLEYKCVGYKFLMEELDKLQKPIKVRLYHCEVVDIPEGVIPTTIGGTHLFWKVFWMNTSNVYFFGRKVASLELTDNKFKHLCNK